MNEILYVKVNRIKTERIYTQVLTMVIHWYVTRLHGFFFSYSYFANFLQCILLGLEWKINYIKTLTLLVKLL